MVVRIRLSRRGRHKDAHYRIMVANASAPRDGKFLEEVGTWAPQPDRFGNKYLRLNIERAKHWLVCGAQPTRIVERLLSKAGVLPPLPVVHRAAPAAIKPRTYSTAAFASHVARAPAASSLLSGGPSLGSNIFQTMLTTVRRLVLHRMCWYQTSNRKDSYTFSDALRDVAEQMQLTDKELLTLYKYFKKADRGGKRKLCADDVFENLGLERTYFLDRLFISVDRDNDGMWSFAEWLTSLAIFNLYTHEKLMDFIFKIFDDDDSGYIDGHELDNFIATIHGPQSLFPMDLSEALALYDEKRDDKIDFVEFKSAEENYPIIMWPAIELQGQMRLRILGLTFWKDLFSRVHPHLVIQHYENDKDDFQERVQAALSSFFSTLKAFFPCIPLMHKSPNLSGGNIRAHQAELAAISRNQDPNKDPMLFDGLHVIQTEAGSNVDSEESIIILTDNDEYDTTMYMEPKRYQDEPETAGESQN